MVKLNLKFTLLILHKGTYRQLLNLYRQLGHSPKVNCVNFGGSSNSSTYLSNSSRKSCLPQGPFLGLSLTLILGILPSSTIYVNTNPFSGNA